MGHNLLYHKQRSNGNIIEKNVAFLAQYDITQKLISTLRYYTSQKNVNIMLVYGTYEGIFSPENKRNTQHINTELLT